MVLDKKTQRRLAKLDALESGGVDNWEWYEESIKDWQKENELYERAEKFIENLNDLLGDAEIEEPAGRGFGYSITFDEEAVIELFIKFAKGQNDD